METNFNRMYSCERCRYFDGDPVDDHLGECCWNIRPVPVTVFRPVCHHYRPDVETPAYYPPLIKNDRVLINALTKEPINDSDLINLCNRDQANHSQQIKIEDEIRESWSDHTVRTSKGGNAR